MPVLDIKDLSVRFATPDGEVAAVSGVDEAGAAKTVDDVLVSRAA